MKKKLLFMLITLFIAVFACGAMCASAETYGDLTYTISDGEVTITDCGSFATSVTIPNKINGYPVTRIGEEAFYYCRSLSSIEIPDSVTSIGSYAFEYCSSLSNVELGDGVTSIGDEAFYNCDRLSSVEIGDSVTSIGDSAFYGCDRLSSVEIGDSVTSIGDDAFCSCNSLSSVKIGNSVTSIGDRAFSGCDSLISIEIPDSVTSIGNYAFCSSLKDVYITDIAAWCNIKFSELGSNPLSYVDNLYLNNELVTDLVIPEGVTSIKEYAFYNCDSLISIEIPDSATSIGDYAFGYCDSLSSVKIGNSVTSIGNSAFSYCDSLKDVYITDIVAWCNIEFSDDDSNPLYYAGNLYLNNKLVTNLVIPEGVTTIKEYAFQYCYSLSSIEIPDSVTSIGDSAFEGCYSLKYVYYNGKLAGWNKITIGSNNDKLEYATRHYFYYVTFVDANENEIKIINVADEAVDISGFEKEGYSVHLYTDKDCTNEFSLQTLVTGNIKLYWKYIPQYTYKFLGEDGSVLKEETVDYGSIITPPENPAKDKTQQYTYTFAGWQGYTEGIAVTEDIEFTAKYDKVINKYTYKFLDEDGSVLKEETVDYGSVITPPEISDKTEYYVFDYWQGYKTGLTVTDNISFTAVYKYKEYLIYANGIEKSITVTYNSNFEIEPQAKKGYKFIGYFTKENGGGEKITNEKGESLKVYNFVGDLTVYPYFEDLYLNKIKVSGESSVQPGEALVCNVAFATDKNIMYIVATVKYPKLLSLNKVKPVDFVEVYTDTERTEGDFKYSEITCVYDYDGNYAPLNKMLVPFEVEFSVSKNHPVGYIDITVENVMLAGDDYYPVTDVISSEIEILPSLVESVEIIAPEKIDRITKLEAVVLPDYAADKAVVWSVDNESVATVTPEGILTPVVNGSVTVTAAAKDGSGVYDTKTIEIISYAKINSIVADNGVWDNSFNSENYEYTIYVTNDTTSISLTPYFTGGTLKPNGSGIWIPGIKKSFDLTGDETVIILNRYNVTGLTDGEYKITVKKFAGVKATVSADGKTFTVATDAIGKTVVLALYNGDKFVSMQHGICNGENLIFNTTDSYTNAKVMVLSDLENISPVYDAVIVK